MPAIMLNAYETGSSLDRHHPAILAMTSAELSELVQWSDMVLFDYITGHYDRLVPHFSLKKTLGYISYFVGH